MSNVPQPENDVIYVFTCEDSDRETVEFVTFDPCVYDLMFDAMDEEWFCRKPVQVQRGDYTRDVAVYLIEERSGLSVRDWEHKLDNGSVDLCPVTLHLSNALSIQLWEVVTG